MSASMKKERRYPVSRCESCSAKTPHLHERIVVNGWLIARRICLTCNAEAPKTLDSPQPSEI
jgi:ribosomal protein L40E